MASEIIRLRSIPLCSGQRRVFEGRVFSPTVSSVVPFISYNLHIPMIVRQRGRPASRRVEQKGVIKSTKKNVSLSVTFTEERKVLYVVM